jgi:PAS domain S-box-containing protein
VEVGLASPVDFHVEYLDFPETTGVPWTPELTDLLRKKYVDRPLDLVAVQRSAALNFLLQNRAALFPGVPVVCFDIGLAEFERLRPPADVTAAFHVSDGQRTVDVALDLVPMAKLVVVIAGGTTADRGAAAYVQQLVAARNPQLETLSLVGLPLEDQLKRLAELPHDSVVVFASYRADALGRSMVAAEVVRLVARTSSAPTFGAVEPWLGRGIVGGDLIRYGPQAQRAGELAVRLLRGEPVAAVRPVGVKSSALMFDWRELRRWGIDEKRVPAGSTVLYREPDFWADHKWEVAGTVGLVLGQGLLIGALLVERRSRRRAQARLVETERRYRTVADFTTDWEYWTRPDGSFAYISPSCLAITGYDTTAFTSRPSLLTEIVVDEDTERWTAHRHAADASADPIRLEFRIRTAAGETRWIDHVCAPVVGEDGANLGVRGSNRDVTERKQSEHDLLRAFEEIHHLRDQLEVDNTYMREQLQVEGGIEGLLATSDVMRYVVSKVQQVAPTSSTVLLQGETGAGKGLVAQAIHDASPRRARPLVTLNCAALPPALIESELFGHEKGAFTGAHAQRIRARRGQRNPEDPRAPDRGHEPQARRRGAGGPFPGGPVVPPERVPDHRAAAAPAAGGHSAARDPFRREALPESRQAGPAGVEGHDEEPSGARLARQCPGTRECRRAGGHLEPGRHARGRRRAPGAGAELHARARRLSRPADPGGTRARPHRRNPREPALEGRRRRRCRRGPRHQPEHAAHPHAQARHPAAESLRARCRDVMVAGGGSAPERGIIDAHAASRP